ncbi:MAG: Sensor histidine kinase RcsC [Chroococcidiopsis sp. SAG 2025]|uniref:response regulator n=1 Tax=Chroococcidiopsis sp. SAG 2025 TaxID=171389 RepID=UPI0029373AEF|nr:response regulator [Chroococcidiopsis sp. SAG 2025]MDV2991346.1 Sensor histidine kinase RcsC [Chroococcidiopsis sp. SAG 2025]
MSVATAEPGTILVVDDTPTNLEILFDFLTNYGFKILIAEDGESALQKAAYASPDLILLDILMPGIDGFETCSRLKASESTREIPVIFMTALSETADKVKGLQVGAVDYVTKPLQHEEVLARVQTHLRLRSLTKQLQAQNVQLEQEIEQRQRQYQRSQLFAEVTLKIRQSLQLEDILQAAAIEVQKILQADRVVIYRLRSDGTGSAVAEAVLPGWFSVLGQQFAAEVFPEDCHQLYCQGRIRGIADVEREENIAPCLVEFMRQFQVKAKLVVPIIIKEELWGLLIAHQCSSSRDWTDFETELLGQLADQIGIAITQAQLLEQETRYSQELARSNAELQQFASIASHDLQEPLRKIQAFGNRLQEKYGEVLSEQGADYIRRMQNAAQRMQILIDDLLVFSRITTRAQPFVVVNLAKVAKEVLSDLEVSIQQTEAHVELSELPTIHADPLQMRQLLQNLIGNALKFRRKNKLPRVKIYSQIIDNREQLTENSLNTHLCQITVEDNGIGFDQKYCDRIFQVFQRLHGRSEYEGTGIGLAICRKIAERHGGSITAESTPSQGAKFIVTLPVHQSID